MPLKGLFNNALKINVINLYAIRRKFLKLLSSYNLVER